MKTVKNNASRLTGLDCPNELDFNCYIEAKLPRRYAVVLSFSGGEREVVVRSFLTFRRAVQIVKDYNRTSRVDYAKLPIAYVHRMVCKVKCDHVDDLLI